MGRCLLVEAVSGTQVLSQLSSRDLGTIRLWPFSEKKCAFNKGNSFSCCHPCDGLGLCFSLWGVLCCRSSLVCWIQPDGVSLPGPAQHSWAWMNVTRGVFLCSPSLTCGDLDVSNCRCIPWLLLDAAAGFNQWPRHPARAQVAPGVISSPVESDCTSQASWL